MPEKETSYIVSMRTPAAGVRAGALVLTLAAFAVAQDNEPLIKVDVDLVNILASVRNKSGALIGNLEKTDFKIYEDGKEQQIKNFTRETDLPLLLFGLVPVLCLNELRIASGEV